MENYSNDNIARINAIRDEALQKAAKTISKYGKPRYIAALLEIIISCIAIVGIEIVSMGFDVSKLIEWQFWVKTFSLTACIFLLYRAVINARFETTASRDNVTEVMQKYKELSDEKDLDLKDFLVEFNMKTKISVYVSKITKRINRLERKKIKTYSLRKKEALTAKINVLKQEIAEERIKEVIDMVHVKYDVVWYDDFENIEKIGGNNGRIITRGYQAYNRAFNKASFNKIWMYIGCSALMAISIFTFGDSSMVQIISNTLASALMIVVRVTTAFVEADRIYDSTITSAYVCKTDILKEYFKWKNEKVEEELKKQIKANEYEKPIIIGNNKIEVAN